MKNIDKYNAVFIDAFSVEISTLKNLQYQDIVSWDSVGHMQLMTALESTFDIEIDIDDIIDFSSYAKGKTILAKYGVTM
jgi:acyl carrier protein